MSRNRVAWIGALTVALVAIVVFWRTAYPSIDWWDSADYSLAAGTFAVTGAPGSLILVLLGWPVVHLFPGDSPAHRLNLFAGVLGAATALMVYVAALALDRLADADARSRSAPVIVAAASGALALAFGRTAWEYSVSITPYILTTVVTGIILWVMLRWWETADEPRSWRLLVLLGVLYGLDFSVHRTNALLIPATLAWVVIRKPRAFVDWRNWVGATSGLIGALSLQFLWLPIGGLSRSPLMWVAPRDLHQFWRYISLADRGGGFLLDVFERKSPFWSSQAADFWRVFARTYFGWSAAIGVAGVFGLAMLWKRSRRLGIAFTVTLSIHAALTVIYFNIPADYFRSLDRHYLPVLVTFAVPVAFGFMELVRIAGRRRLAPLAAATCIAAAGAQLVRNFHESDASNRYFAADYARNVLQALPPRAIHFTVGDNDTFPLLYMQALEGVRPDVLVVNYSVATIADIPERMRRVVPDAPMRSTAAERRAMQKKLPADTIVDVPVHAEGDTGLPAGTALPASVTLHAAVFGQDGPMTLGDLAMVDVISTNAWRRPMTLSVTAGDPFWLKPYARLDGLFWRILPVANVPPDLDRLRRLLSLEYRGYADPSVEITGATINMSSVYYQAFRELIDLEAKTEPSRCGETARRVAQLLPTDRLPFDTSPWRCG